MFSDALDMFFTERDALLSVSSDDARSRRDNPICNDFRELASVSRRFDVAGVSFVGERNTSWFSKSGDLFTARTDGTDRFGDRSSADCDRR